MSDTAKILVLGSAHGSLPAYLSKLRQFNTKHGPFTAVFCIGSFFSPPNYGVAVENEGLGELLEGKLEVPVRTWVLAGLGEVPKEVREKLGEGGGEICPNLVLLEGIGRLELPSGVHVSYDSSTSPVNVSELEPASVTHILLTQSHPSLVFPHLPTSAGENDADLLLKHRRPRYAFSGASGVWEEKAPFGWPASAEGGGEEWTRCVSLGSVRGEGGKKQRFYYAFSLNPSQPPQAPVSTIPNPYLPPPPPTNSSAPELTAPAPPSLKDLQSKSHPTSSAANKRKFEAIALSESQSTDYRWGGEGAEKKPKPSLAERGKKPPEGYRCRICDSADHYVQNCPEKAERDAQRAAARDTDPPPEGYICKRCGQAGHYVRLCPTRDEVGDTGGGKPPEGYRCRACGVEGGHWERDCAVAERGRSRGGRGRGRGRGRGGERGEIGPDECWFCLSNPNVTKHLITSIGSETYLTLPKGSLLPLSSPLPTHIPGGGHLLLIPITHHPTLLSLPPALALSVTAEIESFKSALRSLFRAHGCELLVWEIGRHPSRGAHAHLQLLPVPQAMADSGAVEEAFRREGEAGGVDWEEEGPEAAGKTREGEYLRVELPGKGGKVLVHSIRPGPPFNLQFPRMVLGKLLGVEGRIDWRQCPEGEEEEREAAEEFKRAFAEFDPTLA